MMIDPKHVDRLIVHQFDPAFPSPGGIDTCIRGLARYSPASEQLAIVGVSNGPHQGRNVGERVGKWERHNLGGETFWFLPVAVFDPADQKRKVPHSVRLVAGVVRHLAKLPKSSLAQFHRMDTALTLGPLLRRPYAYLIHTQQSGMAHETSDSIWRYFGNAHESLEKRVVRGAKYSVVFNEEYSSIVRTWGESPVMFSPTWFDPQLLRPAQTPRASGKLIWVGRMETPKDPLLALETFAHLAQTDPDGNWHLEMLGVGTLLDSVNDRLKSLDGAVSRRVTLCGRVAPSEVAEKVASSSAFLMTSHPGYEGYPRVLVEALAAGIPAVVTDGSDTGKLVVNQRNGFTCSRNPAEIAGRIRETEQLSSAACVASVADLSAVELIPQIFAGSNTKAT